MKTHKVKSLYAESAGKRLVRDFANQSFHDLRQRKARRGRNLPSAITAALLLNRPPDSDSAPPSSQPVETPAALAKLKFFSAAGRYAGQDEVEWDMLGAREQTAA